MMFPYDRNHEDNQLTNEQWNIPAPMLKKPPRLDGRGRPRRDDREVLEGILWVLKTGAQWKALPREYPPYQTCHHRLQEWRDRNRIAGSRADGTQSLRCGCSGASISVVSVPTTSP